MSIKVRMELYASEADYLKALESRSQLPGGFRAASVPLTFYPREVEKPEPMNMNLTLLLCEKASSVFAGVFTRNSFPGAPVVLSKEVMGREALRGILINNKIANVCAPNDRENSLELTAALARELGTPSDTYLPASTGVIGWELPLADMKKALPSLAESINRDPDSRSALGAARGIMTTDAYPKVRSAAVGDGSVVGIAKGAGMIEPNMATMLVFLLTDIALPRPALQQVLSEVVEETFNTISIDGDQSTSDMVICVSSGNAEGIGIGSFTEGLGEVCAGLAEDIVRNGEGTGHVLRVLVEGAAAAEHARVVGKGIINSPLVKTAIFGNDPNVGRILMSIGDSTGSAGIPVAAEDLRIFIGDQLVFQRGRFELDQRKEARIADYLQSCALVPDGKSYPEHDRTVDIRVDLGSGDQQASVIGSDLSYEYVRENADYRT